jgi:hypothetical protein
VLEVSEFCQNEVKELWSPKTTTFSEVEFFTGIAELQQMKGKKISVVEI